MFGTEQRQATRSTGCGYARLRPALGQLGTKGLCRNSRRNGGPST